MLPPPTQPAPIAIDDLGATEDYAEDSESESESDEDDSDDDDKAPEAGQPVTHDEDQILRR